MVTPPGAGSRESRAGGGTKSVIIAIGANNAKGGILLENHKASNVNEFSNAPYAIVQRF